MVVNLKPVFSGDLAIFIAPSVLMVLWCRLDWVFF